MLQALHFLFDAGPPLDVITYVTKGGILGLLIVIVIGGMRGWYVWQWQYQALIKEKEEWKDLALSGTRIADSAVATAEHAARGR